MLSSRGAHTETHCHTLAHWHEHTHTLRNQSNQIVESTRLENQSDWRISQKKRKLSRLFLAIQQNRPGDCPIIHFAFHFKKTTTEEKQGRKTEIDWFLNWLNQSVERFVSEKIMMHSSFSIIDSNKCTDTSTGSIQHNPVSVDRNWDRQR